MYHQRIPPPPTTRLRQGHFLPALPPPPPIFGDVTPSQNKRLGQSAQRGRVPLLPLMPTRLLSEKDAKRNLSMYDDPAFSPDPLAHPFHDAWLFNHGTHLEPAIHSFPPLAYTSPPDETMNHLQPPGWVDDNTTTLSHETTLSLSSASASSHSTAPTSHETHSFKLTSLPVSVQQQFAELAISKPSPLSTSEKENSLTMFWRKMQPETNKMEPEHHALVEADGKLWEHMAVRPPPYEALASDNSKPVSESRLASNTVAEVKPPSAGARHVIAGVAISLQELDRIDELDESNPLGVAVHHSSPYEIALKAIAPQSQPVEKKKKKKKELHNIGSEYQVTSTRSSVQDGSQKPNRRTSKAPIPYVPPGVSLNLKPGEILPYDFQSQYFYPSRASHSPTMPSYERAPPQLEIPKANARRDDFDMITQNGHDAPTHVMPTNNRVHVAPSRPGHRSSMPPPPPPTPVASPAFRHSVQQPVPRDVGNSMPPSMINAQAQFSGAHTPGPPAERPPSRSNYARLPPRMQALRREQAKNAERHVDEALHHSFRPVLESWEQTGGSKENIPIHTISLPIESSPRMSFVLVERDLAAHSHFIVDSSTPAPPEVVLPRTDASATQGPVLNRNLDAAPQPLRSLREHDSRSVQHSFTDNSTLSASSGGSGGQARRPHHVPKHLVMPAPLQKSQPQAVVAPRHRSNLPPRYDTPPRHQPPPPSSLLSPQPHTHALPHRAQDIPVFVPHNNKLRKRGGAQLPQPPVISTPAPAPAPAPLPPFPSNRPLSFEPVLDYRNILAPETYIGKLDKPSKKVLSKRRD